MNSTLETLDDNKVKLSVTIEESEFEPSVDEAYKVIAKEVRMPGFRPGKVPRKLLEKQFGPEMAREEALRTSLPEFYSKAVYENDVDVIAPPEIDITGGQAEGDISFDAVVEVRPSVTVSGHDGLRVEIPSPHVTDDDLQERLDSIRAQHAELEAVEREAADDDHVMIDIAGTIDGEPVPGLTAEDYDYVVGSGAVVAEIDDNLRGAKAGDELEFSADHPDESQDDKIDFVLKVKEVQEQVLPEANDDFAKEASEFETIDELRDDLSQRLEDVKRSQAVQALDAKTGEALAALVTDEISEALVEDEMENRGQDMAMRLQAQGIQLEQYLQITGTTPEMFREQLREQAEVSARVDLALRSIADSEGIDVTDEEVDVELRVLATQLDQTLETVREQLETAGRLKAIRSDMRIRAAMQWVTERAEIVDENGNAVDRDLLEHDHEHDHDDADHGSEEE
ncbi:MAG: trigger factor [Verrucomicrobiales bacterium]